MKKAGLWRLFGWGGSFMAGFLLREEIARRRSGSPEANGQYFRAGAGAVIIDSEGRVLAFERRNQPAAWQLPQGGLEAGEDPLLGVWREVAEETGILPRDLELLARAPRLTVYELPPEYRWNRGLRGQVHYWFLFRFTGAESAINLGEKEEFRNWRWMSFADLTARTIPFRRAVYRELAGHFGEYLGEATRS